MIPATFAITLSGKCLPMQILYTGKTERWHPCFSEFPPEFDIWHSPNHWVNHETSIRFLNNVIIPYVEKTRAEKELTIKPTVITHWQVHTDWSIIYKLLIYWKLKLIPMKSHEFDRIILFWKGYVSKLHNFSAAWLSCLTVMYVQYTVGHFLWETYVISHYSASFMKYFLAHRLLISRSSPEIQPCEEHHLKTVLCSHDVNAHHFIKDAL